MDMFCLVFKVYVISSASRILVCLSDRIESRLETIPSRKSTLMMMRKCKEGVFLGVCGLCSAHRLDVLYPPYSLFELNVSRLRVPT